MTEQDFIPGSPGTYPELGTFGWQAPSNIALVKYWGKNPGQIPANASISFTLEASASRTSLKFRQVDARDGVPEFDVFLGERPAPDFKGKIRSFFERILPYQPFLSRYAFEIHTENTFPHSSGIASSASGMAALALCLMDLEQAIYQEMEPEGFYRKASFLARLGSGSASRSIRGPLVHWGEHGSVPGSSDLFGIPYPLEVAPVFTSYCDTILLVDRGQKQVSSSAGHGLMKSHPFAGARFEQAGAHIDALQTILRQGDLDAFVTLVESEALTLHAMMMTSEPYYILMKPGTLEVLERIWAYRRSSGEPVCFTLDAGANVHLLYPDSSREAVAAFIADELLPFCQDRQYISDRVGEGAKRL